MLYNLFENRDFVSVFAVALLAEGVDRNQLGFGHSLLLVVALLAEGVDRNSLWIWVLISSMVALLAEGVDRNSLSIKSTLFPAASPSSRRAWIEIICFCSAIIPSGVALLAEGVDRNCFKVL